MKQLELFDTVAALAAATPSAYPWVGAEKATWSVVYKKSAE